MKRINVHRDLEGFPKMNLFLLGLQTVTEIYDRSKRVKITFDDIEGFEYPLEGNKSGLVIFHSDDKQKEAYLGENVFNYERNCEELLCYLFKDDAAWKFWAEQVNINPNELLWLDDIEECLYKIGRESSNEWKREMLNDVDLLAEVCFKRTEDRQMSLNVTVSVIANENETPELENNAVYRNGEFYPGCFLKDYELEELYYNMPFCQAIDSLTFEFWL